MFSIDSYYYIAYLIKTKHERDKGMRNIILKLKTQIKTKEKLKKNTIFHKKVKKIGFFI